MLSSILTTTYLVVTSVAQTAGDGICTTVQECMPILTNNDEYRPKEWKRLIGGQNFTWCCTKAIADSLFVDTDGKLAVKDYPPALDLNVTLLEIVTDRGLFPCNAHYDSEYLDGSPEINVNYTWLAENCPGWELSDSTDLNVLQTISGFLLPAVIFCLSIPRRRKFHVFRKFFVADLAGVKSYVPAFFGAVGAMFIVSLDTLVWLSVCFALAGPMILSGLYEALIDSRVIDFVNDKIKNGRLTLDMSCRLLMVVLIGNLDLAIDDDPLVNLTGGTTLMSGVSPNISPVRASTTNPTCSSSNGESGPRSSGSDRRTLNHVPIVGENVGESLQVLMHHGSHGLGVITGDNNREHQNVGASEQPLSSQPEPQIPVDGPPPEQGAIQRRSTTHLSPSPWRHMEELLYPIRLYDDTREDRKLSPRQYPLMSHRLSQDCPTEGFCRNKNHLVQEKPYPRNAKIERHISKTRTRLRTMLNCQYSFGSMVGAPVLFFLGGFIFALLQSLQEMGDESTALALAFGQWYMTIPHIAIISGLLLAGNNPNILEGVLATQRQNIDKPTRIFFLEFGLAYPSCYKVAWQWHRGPNKKRWIETLISTYSERDETWESRGEYYYRINQEDMKMLQEMTTPSSLDWMLLLSMSGLLLGVPFVLAFLTAFYTPEIGVSCRSLTFTIYASAQFGQILLWLWAVSTPWTPRRNYGLVPTGSEVPKIRRQGTKIGSTLLGLFRRGGWLEQKGFYNPRSVDHFLRFDPDEPRNAITIGKKFMSTDFFCMQSLWCCTWYFFYVLLGIIAALAAIGGTLMQILGVYRSDICYLTIDKWVDPFKPGNTALISSNSRFMILDAQKFWKPCAITAIAFMSFVSFVGWWYQRRTRDVFMGIVSNIEFGSRKDTEEAKGTPKEYVYTTTLSGSPYI